MSRSSLSSIRSLFALIPSLTPRFPHVVPSLKIWERVELGNQTQRTKGPREPENYENQRTTGTREPQEPREPENQRTTRTREPREPKNHENQRTTRTTRTRRTTRTTRTREPQEPREPKNHKNHENHKNQKNSKNYRKKKGTRRRFYVTKSNKRNVTSAVAITLEISQTSNPSGQRSLHDPGRFYPQKSDPKIGRL